MTLLREDLRASWRMLLAHPVVNAIAIVSLALGIGANTAIFSFVNAFLLRPPAVADGSHLLEVWNHSPHSGSPMNGFVPLTYPDFAYLRDHNHVFSGFAAFNGETNSVVWNRAGQGEVIQAQFVTANYFSVLGVNPALGRGFLPEEDRISSARPTIVLSYSFWKAQLNSDPAILGKSLLVNGHHLLVVGVAPQNFHGMMVVFNPDFWASAAAAAAVEPNTADLIRNGDAYWLFAIGRMRPGVGQSQVQADLNVLSKQMATTHAKNMQDVTAEAFPAQLTPAPVRGYITAFVGGAMLLVLLVLLIACANAANLLLAQAAERRREIAVRLALGAGRARLILSMLTHSLVLATIAGSLGVLLAYWAAPMLLLLKPSNFPISLDVSMDWRVLAYTVGVSALTGLLFGLAPALRATRVDISDDLRDGVQVGGTARSRIRELLVIGQIAACLVLLVGSGLALRSLYNARSIEPGFNSNGVLAGRTNVEAAGYNEQRGAAVYREILERVRALPGVASASMVNYLPLGASIFTRGVAVNGQTTPESVQTFIVAEDYFKTMQTRLLAGREFTSADSKSAANATIVNDQFAHKFWPGQDALGRSVMLIDGQKRVPAEIVGIVSTGKYRSLGEAPTPVMFQPLSQAYDSRMVLLVRSQGNRTLALLPALRRLLQSMDTNLALIEPQTLNQAMALPLFTANLAGTLFTTFATLALTLALIGLYGVIAFSVSQRTREIGVRIALGAATKDVLRLVVGGGLRLAIVCIGVGLPIAFIGARTLSSLLYGIRPWDPATFAAVPLFLIGTASLAGYLPALRAARLNPLVALRHE